MATHSPAAPSFVCPEEGCGKVYRSAQALKAHQAACHGEEKHVCEICGAEFAYKVSLVKHMARVHEGESEANKEGTEKEGALLRTVERLTGAKKGEIDLSTSAPALDLPDDNSNKSPPPVPLSLSLSLDSLK